jgi:hypothetical protein
LPDDLDRDFGMPVGLALAGIFVLVVALIVLLPPRPSTESPPNIKGCYSSPGLPDILIGDKFLTIAQNRPRAIRYRLEYHKDWALSLRDWLQLARSGESQGLEVKRGRAQFIFFNKELEISPPGLGFRVSDFAAGRSAFYVRKGDECTSH